MFKHYYENLTNITLTCLNITMNTLLTQIIPETPRVNINMIHILCSYCRAIRIVRSIALTTKVVSTNPTPSEVSTQQYVIQFVSDLRQISGFHRVLQFPLPDETDRHDIVEILLKVSLNTMPIMPIPFIYQTKIQNKHWQFYFEHYLVNLEHVNRQVPNNEAAQVSRNINTSQHRQSPPSSSQGLLFGSPFSAPLADPEYILRIRALIIHWLRLPVHISIQNTSYTEHMLSTKGKRRWHRNALI